MNQEILEHIRKNAELVISVAKDELGQTLNYDLEGVTWLDGYIQRQHNAGLPVDPDQLTNTLGSYLGECVIRSYGGEWAEIDGVIGIKLDGNNAIFPFSKVLKHLENGSEDSVKSFYEIIPLVFGLSQAQSN